MTKDSRSGDESSQSSCSGLRIIARSAFVCIALVATVSPGAPVKFSQLHGGPVDSLAVEAERASYRYYFRASRRARPDEVRRLLGEFDSVFRAASERVFGAHGLPAPRRMAIAVAGDAQVFQGLTGRPWFVAGLYDPLSGRLYFQNPAALRRRGILKSTVVHELCHVAMARARRGHRDGIQGSAEMNARAPAWLEEGYCEALAETPCAANRQAVNRVIRTAADWQAFDAWFGSRLRGEASRADRRLGFCVAALFAADWTAAVGRKRAFAYLAGFRPGDAGKGSDSFTPRRFYQRFRNKFR